MAGLRGTPLASLCGVNPSWPPSPQEKRWVWDSNSGRGLLLVTLVGQMYVQHGNYADYCADILVTVSLCAKCLATLHLKLQFLFAGQEINYLSQCYQE